MLKNDYLKVLAFACLIPLLIPFISKLLLYLGILSLITNNYAQYMLYQINQFFDITIPLSLGKILSLMFWPIVITFMIDLFSTYVLKKAFKQQAICAILLWLLFNSGTFLVR